MEFKDEKFVDHFPETFQKKIYDYLAMKFGPITSESDKLTKLDFIRHNKDGSALGNLRMEDLGLDVRTVRALHWIVANFIEYSGVDFSYIESDSPYNKFFEVKVSDFVKIPVDEIANARNFGKKSLNNLKEELAKYGFVHPGLDKLEL